MTRTKRQERRKMIEEQEKKNFDGKTFIFEAAREVKT